MSSWQSIFYEFLRICYLSEVGVKGGQYEVRRAKTVTHDANTPTHSSPYQSLEELERYMRYAYDGWCSDSLIVVGVMEMVGKIIKTQWTGSFRHFLCLLMNSLCVFRVDSLCVTWIMESSFVILAIKYMRLLSRRHDRHLLYPLHCGLLTEWLNSLKAQTNTYWAQEKQLFSSVHRAKVSLTGVKLRWLL